MIPINDELLFLTKATGLATCAMYKRLRNDRQKTEWGLLSTSSLLDESKDN